MLWIQKHVFLQCLGSDPETLKETYEGTLRLNIRTHSRVFKDHSIRTEKEIKEKYNNKKIHDNNLLLKKHSESFEISNFTNNRIVKSSKNNSEFSPNDEFYQKENGSDATVSHQVLYIVGCPLSKYWWISIWNTGE